MEDILDMDLWRQKSSWLFKFMVSILAVAALSRTAEGLSVPSNELYEQPRSWSESPEFAVTDLSSPVIINNDI